MASVNDPVLKRSFRGHKNIITAISFSPNLKQLASSSEDSAVNIWSFHPNQREFKLSGHKGPIYDVAFSPNGQVIASASKDETVRLWQNSAENHSTTIKAHNGGVRSVRFSLNGKLLLTSSDDTQVKVWYASDKKLLSNLSGHYKGVRSAEFSHDTRYIASGGEDRTVRIWDTNHKQELHTFSEHKGIINSVKFHPDGTCVASGSHDKKIKIWDVRSRTLLQHYDAHSESVNQIAFHPNGNYLISASDDSKLKVWDLRQGKLLHSLFSHAGRCTAINFSDGGDFFCSGGSDNIVMVWKSNFEESVNEYIEDIVEPRAVNSHRIIQTAYSEKKLPPKDDLRSDYTNSRRLFHSAQKSASKISCPLTNIQLLNENINSTQAKVISESHHASKIEKNSQEGLVECTKSYINQENHNAKISSDFIAKLPDLLLTSFTKIENQLEVITKSIIALDNKLRINEDHVSNLMRIVGNKPSLGNDKNGIDSKQNNNNEHEVHFNLQQ